MAQGIFYKFLNILPDRSFYSDVLVLVGKPYRFNSLTDDLHRLPHKSPGIFRVNFPIRIGQFKISL